MSPVELVGEHGAVDGAGGGIDDWPWLADLLDREPPPPVSDGQVNARFWAAVAELLGERCGEADRAPGAVDAGAVDQAGAAVAACLPALGGLCDHDLVTEIAAGERRLAVVAAQQLRAMVELAGRSVFTLADNKVLPGKVRARLDAPEERAHRAAVEISAALTIAPQTASIRLGEALRLVEDYPGTLAEVGTGRLSLSRARVILEETEVLYPVQRAIVEAKALDVAASLTPGKLRRKVAAWVLGIDPRSAERRHGDAMARRGFAVRPQRDGMATVSADTDAAGAQTVFAACDAVAEGMRVPGDRRGVGARRADALVAICRDVLTAGHTGCGNPHCGDTCLHPATRPTRTHPTGATGTPAGTGTPTGTAAAAADGAAAEAENHADPTGSPYTRSRTGTGAPMRCRPVSRRQGRRPNIQVTVAISTLMRADDLPARLTGHGWITAEAARRIAADGDWVRLLTDPKDGRLLEYGRAHRDPPQELRDYVIARDITDRFPTSNIPAYQCDIDHSQDWELGGHTGQTNNYAVSPGVHQVRHDAGWRVRSPREGHLIWTSPTRHVYETFPEQVGPISRGPHAETTDFPKPDQPDPTSRPPAQDQPPPF